MKAWTLQASLDQQRSTPGERIQDALAGVKIGKASHCGRDGRMNGTCRIVHAPGAPVERVGGRANSEPRLVQRQVKPTPDSIRRIGAAGIHVVQLQARCQGVPCDVFDLVARVVALSQKAGGYSNVPKPRGDLDRSIGKLAETLVQ